jgi:hypothetical protein
MAHKPTETTAAAPPETFTAWKARALAGLDPIAVGLACERELKLFYIKGHPPEEAARYVEMTAYNARRPFERKERGR